MLVPAAAKFHLAYHTHSHNGVVGELNTPAQTGNGLEVKASNAVFLPLRHSVAVYFNCEKRWSRFEALIDILCAKPSPHFVSFISAVCWWAPPSSTCAIQTLNIKENKNGALQMCATNQRGFLFIMRWKPYVWQHCPPKKCKGIILDVSKAAISILFDF